MLDIISGMLASMCTQDIPTYIVNPMKTSGRVEWRQSGTQAGSMYRICVHVLPQESDSLELDILWICIAGKRIQHASRTWSQHLLWDVRATRRPLDFIYRIWNDDCVGRVLLISDAVIVNCRTSCFLPFEWFFHFTSHRLQIQLHVH